MNSQDSITRLAIVSHHPLIAIGLAKVFQDDQRVVIVQERSSLAALVIASDALPPDVTLVDWDLIAQDHDAAKVVGALSRSTQILFLMQTPGARDCRIALEMGARGALSKTSLPATIRRAVWKVAKGGIWMDRTTTESVLEYTLSPTNPLELDRRRLEWLTQRELEIVELVCRGYRNKKIASDLSISETTVCHHLTSVFSKLEVEDRMSLMVFAQRHSLHLASRHQANRLRKSSFGNAPTRAVGGSSSRGDSSPRSLSAAPFSAA
jgi:DNA-binding NarL/FixJ family response regulator